jgi:hypothetical protein
MLDGKEPVRVSGRSWAVLGAQGSPGRGGTFVSRNDNACDFVTRVTVCNGAL